MDATITVTADTGTIRRILSILEEERRSQTYITDDELQGFIRSLNNNCQDVVRSVAVSSSKGGSVSRTALRNMVVFDDDQSPDDTRLNGVIGTIGKWWKKRASGENPFVGRWDSTDQDWAYQIDKELAERLVRELQDQADGWRAQWAKK
jgi:hypothetical protein